MGFGKFGLGCGCCGPGEEPLTCCLTGDIRKDATLNALYVRTELLTPCGTQANQSSGLKVNKPVTFRCTASAELLATTGVTWEFLADETGDSWESGGAITSGCSVQQLSPTKFHHPPQSPALGAVNTYIDITITATVATDAQYHQFRIKIYYDSNTAASTHMQWNGSCPTNFTSLCVMNNSAYISESFTHNSGAEGRWNFDIGGPPLDVRLTRNRFEPFHFTQNTQGWWRHGLNQEMALYKKPALPLIKFINGATMTMECDYYAGPELSQTVFNPDLGQARAICFLQAISVLAGAGSSLQISGGINSHVVFFPGGRIEVRHKLQSVAGVYSDISFTTGPGLHRLKCVIDAGIQTPGRWGVRGYVNGTLFNAISPVGNAPIIDYEFCNPLLHVGYRHSSLWDAAALHPTNPAEYFWVDNVSYTYRE